MPLRCWKVVALSLSTITRTRCNDPVQVYILKWRSANQNNDIKYLATRPRRWKCHAKYARTVIAMSLSLVWNHQPSQVADDAVFSCRALYVFSERTWRDVSLPVWGISFAFLMERQVPLMWRFVLSRAPQECSIPCVSIRHSTPDRFSDEYFPILSSWLENCKRHHTCAPPDVPLPTRVLHVGVKSSNRVRLHATHQEPSVSNPPNNNTCTSLRSYIAFSHYWGKNGFNRVRTTRETIQ